jgi:hypothetical protein
MECWATYHGQMNVRVEIREMQKFDAERDEDLLSSRPES